MRRKKILPKCDDGKTYVSGLMLPEVTVTPDGKIDPWAMPTLEQFVQANLKKYMPGIKITYPRNINPLYNSLLRHYDDGKDIEEIGLNNEYTQQAKNWLIDQLTPRKDTFVNSSYDDDDEQGYSFAKMYKDQFDEDAKINEYRSKVNFNTNWMSKDTKNFYNNWLKDNEYSYDSANDALWTYLTDKYWDKEKLIYKGDEYSKYWDYVQNVNKYAKLYAEDQFDSGYKKWKSDRYDQGINAIRNAYIFNPFSNMNYGDTGVTQDYLLRGLTGAKGFYSGDLKNPKNWIAVKGDDNVSTMIHELNHLGQSYWGKDGFDMSKKYEDRWHEQHSRGKLLMYDTGVPKSGYYSPDDIKKLREDRILLKYGLDRYYDIDLMNILNYALQNSNNSDNDILMAYFGKSPRKILHL